jgi:hypothetical protein
MFGHDRWHNYGENWFQSAVFVERHTVEVSIVSGKNGQKVQVDSAWISQHMLY